MFKAVQPFLLYCQTSVHAGTGSEIGIIDLPIQRERHTGFPKIESSSLKGAIRAAVQETLAEQESEKKRIELVFGGEPGPGDTSAGAIAFGDARILLFPVKSFKGVFAWVTCPMVLERFSRELRDYAQREFIPAGIRPHTTSGKKLLIGDKIILEEYTFAPIAVDQKTEELGMLLQEQIFGGYTHDMAERILVLADDDFLDFVKLSTEVTARIRIDPKTGTVHKGALWNEENVPPETVFYSFAFAGNVRSAHSETLQSATDVLSFLRDGQNFPAIFQLGGNYTLGRGIMRRIWI